MIQKIIINFDEERREYITEAILANFLELATDKQGLCVMKKLIEWTKKPSNQQRIVDKIVENGLLYV
jgi:hypothetical protein